MCVCVIQKVCTIRYLTIDSRFPYNISTLIKLFHEPFKEIVFHITILPAEDVRSNQVEKIWT